jgi:hypothetical protein
MLKTGDQTLLSTSFASAELQKSRPRLKVSSGADLEASLNRPHGYKRLITPRKDARIQKETQKCFDKSGIESALGLESKINLGYRMEQEPFESIKVSFL